MTSWVELGNLALSRLGEYDFITSLTDGTKPANLINRNYVSTRKQLLRLHLWNFALKRVELAPSVETPGFGSNNYFLLPADCLRVIKDPLNPQLNFNIEQTPAGNRAIYFDGTVFNLYYVADIEEPALFDALFVDCYANLLAKNICIGLTGSRTMFETMEAMFRRSLTEARSIDGSEGGVMLQYADDFINSRA